MGWLGSGLTFRVSCLILVWAAGAGGVKVLRQPSCFSDYLSTSTCEWKMDGPTNCSAKLHLAYLLEFSTPPSAENYTCIPENRDSTVCVCNMRMENMVFGDTYLLDLWAGTQRLWSGTFSPGEYVKPRAPENLTIQANTFPMWKLDWINPYSAEDFLSSVLFYLVNISNENDPTDFREYNVDHRNTTLLFPATALKSGVFYIIRVKAHARHYNGTWSEWSPSIRWWNYYELSWEQHLPLAVSISCIAILVIFLSCYFSILRIKKQWWDQIPNPAHSRLMTIVIQESQVSLWRKQPRGQDPAKCPHWKTCLTKLLPCLLEHGVEKDDDSSKAARNGPLQGPGKSAWHSVEVSKTILWPESISVVKRVDLLEAPGESEEEEEVEEDKGSFCPSPKSSGGSFQEGREGIAARLTESLFLDLLGAENGGFCPQGLGESCLLPPSESEGAQMPWAEFPSAGPQAASFQGQEQPLNTESNPPVMWQQSPRCLPFTETTAVIADNPAYRSFSNFMSQSSGPGELDSPPQLAERLGDGDLTMPCASQSLEPPTALQPEPETWEQVLRRTVLQHVAAPAPAPAPTSGYREFMCAVKQGNAQAGETVGFGPSGEAGYKSFAGLLARGATCPGTPGVEASSGEGGYKPFQSLTPACPEASAPTPAPLFTFGLDMELFQSPQKSPLPSSSAEGLLLEPVAKGENGQKPPLPPEEAPDPVRDDLGSGFVYSALTCHLCGQLKQCHGLEERGKAHVVATPCCGCCCPDGSSPLVSPLRVPDPLPGGVPLEARLTASLAPSGVSEKGKPSLFSQPAQSSAQSSSHTPNVVATLSAGLTCMSAS
nr:PREDICTED: interleukin-4 receptor subunit alpha isoform X1 [Rhinolophus sinicus]XP_019573646.1 PREDICTED: interleukin-4 receptor subunit alpha isoform X1 [Rhinolophus sinicus]XP_019573647.1 PREDICTED: interleukin-4 receptor subunit alpha isoform X1 [Rhinolophus sinicus]XP_019573648.1 PREDICTED: interleukin-4 receptor subunit alpha isoform X1 [Rhinolophus sinicus]XP_019573649.1 PREDICTED: interleukin-4 receptor subunit alpha isoform X1 [Rhinolophus sinicus]